MAKLPRLASTLAIYFEWFFHWKSRPTHVTIAGQQMARLALALALCFIGAANGFGVTPPAREECPDVNIDRGAACDVAGEACDIYAGEDIFYDAGVCLQIEIPDVSTGAYIKLPRRV